MNDRPTGVIERFKRLDVGDIGVSSITVSELHYGISKSANRKMNQHRVEEFLYPLEVLPYDQIAAESYGMIRYLLEERGNPIGPLDMLIAAHALSRNLIVVTNNEKEFKRVNGLKVENWLTSSG